MDSKTNRPFGQVGPVSGDRETILGLSADPVDDCVRWPKDIDQTQGHKVNDPLIGDPALEVANAWQAAGVDEVQVLVVQPAEHGVAAVDPPREQCAGRTRI
jgi:alkyl hydroperoxide reductase subunit AhpC